MGRIHPYELDYRAQPMRGRARAQAVRMFAVDWLPVMATNLLLMAILLLALTLV
ncbi:MAG: hypothetical protein KatS3mg059_1536 [Thermomicrobiales bacterium]|nr:MAG: hypothetical protein KatS3mg059_1536 [Thermomicrobiales bacterium]